MHDVKTTETRYMFLSVEHGELDRDYASSVCDCCTACEMATWLGGGGGWWVK